MPLTDAAVRQAKPRDKDYKLADGGGLYLLVKTTGGKYWRLKYRVDRKEKLLAMGVYPDVTLAYAREKRDEARKTLVQGLDPGVVRKAIKTAKGEKAANSFEVVAREWFEKMKPTWADTHSEKIIRRLEVDVFPWLGDRPIADITAPEILTVLRRVEERGVKDTPKRVAQNCGQVFRYAIATGRAERNPVPDLRGALTTAKTKHFAAITDPKIIGKLWLDIKNYKGMFVTRCALQLAPLLFVRPGELRQAEWGEFDLEKALWSIPKERMKMKQPHLVPLPRQAVEILRDLHALTGRNRYVFPGVRSHDRPMSENAINAALRYMGYAKEEMTGHGFRAMARTTLDEVLGHRPDIIEHQLAHAVRDPLGRAYNRTKHLAERQVMMQDWADYLDKLEQDHLKATN